MQIVVDVQINKSRNATYNYSATSEQFAIIEIGSQVIINFNNQLKVGIVKSKLLTESTEYKLKPILQIVRQSPLNTYQQQLFNLIADNSFASLFTLHSLFNKPIGSSKIDLNFFDEDDKLVGTFNSSKNKQHLIDNYRSELVVSYKQEPQKIMYIGANENVDINSLTPKQSLVYEYLETNGISKLSQVIEECNISRGVITTMIDKQRVVVYNRPRQFEELYQIGDNQFTHLTDEQHQVVISQESGRVNLLHGVSSSGKTEVYIQLVKQTVSAGKQALVIVPSIMLAIQIVGKFQHHFPNCLIFHRNLSEDRKKSYTQQIADGTQSIVIATIDGLFLPFKNLGQIIVDEAHHASYYLEKKININTIIIFEQLGKTINVLLGTATPTITQYAKATKGVYKLLQLTKPYHGLGKQKLEFVESSNLLVNPSLAKLITDNKKSNLPTMILYNVNGYARQIMCESCFYVPLCPTCNKPLTYHRMRNILKCKYDGYQVNYQHRCPNCFESKFQYVGIGIEQFTSNLQTDFPELTIRQVDNSLSSDNLYQLMVDFANGDIDILVGTQIISFGIDFLNVQSIYIANIDRMLTLDEFDAFERSYNLLEQSAKRVGRMGSDFQVMIETKFPENFVLKAIEENSYLDYFNIELNNRKLGKLPPYYKMCKIMFSCPHLQKLQNMVGKMIIELRNLGIETSELQIPYLDVRNDFHRRYIIITYRENNLKKLLEPYITMLIANKIDCEVDLECNKIGV